MLILQRLRVVPLPNILWPSPSPASFQEILLYRLSENGAEIYQEEVHFPGDWNKDRTINQEENRPSASRIGCKKNQVYLDPRI